MGRSDCVTVHVKSFRAVLVGCKISIGQQCVGLTEKICPIFEYYGLKREGFIHSFIRYLLTVRGGVLTIPSVRVLGMGQ